MLFIKKHFLLVALFQLCFLGYIYSAAKGDTITYSFTNEKLSLALNSLMNQYNISILYINNQVDSIFVNAECVNCSNEQALQNLLGNTQIKWKKLNEQYIVYDPNTDDIVSKTEIEESSNKNIQGYIIDSVSNEPLPYAAISIQGTGTGTVTDKDGFFSFNNLAPNLYKLNILYVGYHTDSLIADLSRNKSTKVQVIKLNPKHIELDAIVIRKPGINRNVSVTKTSVVVFNALRLKTTPTMDQGDIVQNIRLAAGVNIIPDDPMGINLRGGSSDQTLILFDNIPIYHTQHLMGFNGLLNANCTQKIALHSGGFSAQYGDRLSGVIDLKGRSGSGDKFHAGASVNFYTSRGYVDVPLNSKLNLFFTFNKSTDWFGFSEKLLNREDYTYFNFYDQVDYTGKYGTGFYSSGIPGSDYQVSLSDFSDITNKIKYSISQKDTLSMTFISSSDKTNIGSLPSADELKTGERSEQWKSRGISTNYTRKWSTNLRSKIDLVAAMFENNTRFKYLEKDSLLTNYNNINTINQAEISAEVNYDFQKFCKINMGFVYAQIETKLDRFDDTGEIQSNEFSNHTNVSKLTAFTEVLLSPIEQLDLNLGLRSNKISEISGLTFDPRLSLRSRLGDYFSATISWGKYHQFMHRTPSVIAYNLSSIGPTGSWMYSQENLKPSKADHWLAGIHFDTKMFSLHTSVYYKNYNDLHLIIPSQMNIAYIDNTDRNKRSLYIDWIENREVIMSGNHEIDIFSGAGNSKGLEVILSKNRGIYTGFVSYHLSKTEYLFPYMNNGEKFVPAYDHTHELKTMHYLSRYNWNLGSIIYFVSGKPYPNKYPYKNYFDATELNLEHPINWEMNSKERLPLYTNVDLSLSYDIKKVWKLKGTVGFVVQNVFDTRNVISKYYTWENNIESDPELQLNDQLSHNRLFNVFISIEL